ncbi:MAG: MFS transporter [Microbacteriaceae bacterium]|nr:MFS transporter [Microbacteriaceae bacterium]
MAAIASTESRTRIQLTAWRNSLFVIFALCGVGLASWAARVPRVGAILDLPPAQLGLLLLGIAIGSIGGLTASGHLVSRFGARVIIVLTLIGSAIGLVLAAVGTSILVSFTVAFVGLMVFGACMGACDVAMNVSGAANERALKRSVMPIYHAFFSIGTVVGAALGAIAERLDIALPQHIGVLAALIIVLAVIVVRFIPGDDLASRVSVEPLTETDGVKSGSDDSTAAGPGQTSAGPATPRGSVWKDPRTVAIGVIALGMAFAEGTATDWLSYAMVTGHDSSTTTGALVFGVFVAAMTVGRFVGVALLDRFGRVPVLRTSGILAVVGLLLFIFVPVFAVTVIGVVLWGLGASLGFPVAMSAAADDPHTAAARVGAVATIGYIAFLVGPPAIGFIAGQLGILNALLLVAVLVTAATMAANAARAPSLRAGMIPPVGADSSR